MSISFMSQTLHALNHNFKHIIHIIHLDLDLDESFLPLFSNLLYKIFLLKIFFGDILFKTGLNFKSQNPYVNNNNKRTFEDLGD